MEISELYLSKGYKYRPEDYIDERQALAKLVGETQYIDGTLEDNFKQVLDIKYNYKEFQAQHNLVGLRRDELLKIVIQFSLDVSKAIEYADILKNWGRFCRKNGINEFDQQRFIDQCSKTDDSVKKVVRDMQREQNRVKKQVTKEYKELEKENKEAHKNYVIEHYADNMDEFMEMYDLNEGCSGYIKFCGRRQIKAEKVVKECLTWDKYGKNPTRADSKKEAYVKLRLSYRALVAYYEVFEDITLGMTEGAAKILKKTRIHAGRQFEYSGNPNNVFREHLRLSGLNDIMEYIFDLAKETPFIDALGNTILNKDILCIRTLSRGMCSTEDAVSLFVFFTSKEGEVALKCNSDAALIVSWCIENGLADYKDFCYTNLPSGEIPDWTSATSVMYKHNMKKRQREIEAERRRDRARRRRWEAEAEAEERQEYARYVSVAQIKKEELEKKVDKAQDERYEQEYSELLKLTKYERAMYLKNTDEYAGRDLVLEAYYNLDEFCEKNKLDGLTKDILKDWLNTIPKYESSLWDLPYIRRFWDLINPAKVGVDNEKLTQYIGDITDRIQRLRAYVPKCNDEEAYRRLKFIEETKLREVKRHWKYSTDEDYIRERLFTLIGVSRFQSAEVDLTYNEVIHKYFGDKAHKIISFMVKADTKDIGVYYSRDKDSMLRYCNDILGIYLIKYDILNIKGILKYLYCISFRPMKYYGFYEGFEGPYKDSEELWQGILKGNERTTTFFIGLLYKMGEGGLSRTIANCGEFYRMKELYDNPELNCANDRKEKINELMENRSKTLIITANKCDKAVRKVMADVDKQEMKYENSVKEEWRKAKEAELAKKKRDEEKRKAANNISEWMKANPEKADEWRNETLKGNIYTLEQFLKVKGYSK